MALLGSFKNHTALLVSDAGVGWEEAATLLNKAGSVFGSASLISNEKNIEGWPRGANSLWQTAAAHVNEPWFFLEPDAVPLKPDWLDTIANAYKTCGKPFMGCIVENKNPSFPPRYLAGNAVYPANARDIINPFLWNDGPAFDIAPANDVVPLSAHTNLIQNVWGEHKLPPTFEAVKTPSSPVNAFTLDQLHHESVLFHRNKDGSLIRLLRRKLFPATVSDKKFMVVYPFFNGDANLAVKNMAWIARVTKPGTHEIVLSYQSGTSLDIVNRISSMAQSVFTRVHRNQYPAPKPSMVGPNWAWLMAAWHMREMDRAWLWMEPDAVALKSDWLDILQAEYDRCVKPFMGPVVPGMGHINGTAVYPANTPDLLPRTMRTQERFGFDVIMWPEMGSLVHDCSRIFQHAWVERGGRLEPHGHGIEPTFPTRQSISRLNPSAVAFHRNKDSTLIDRLRETFA